MNQNRLDEIKRIYDSSGRGLMWDTIRELVVEVERLRAIERCARYYLSSDGDTYQAYLKLCEACGIEPEEPSEIDEYMGHIEAENKRLQDEVSRLTPKPPRQLTKEEIQQRIDDNFFDEEYA